MKTKDSSEYALYLAPFY